MSHKVQKMAYAGETPWHGIGNVLTPDAPVDTWKTEAGLDWMALRSDVEYTDNFGERQVYPNRQVLVRSDSGLPLSIVSDHYKIVQPPEVLEFFRDLVEDQFSGFRMETAGCLDDGRRVWALARSDDSIVLGKGRNEDRVARYLLLATSFDRSIGTIVQQTAVRVVCWNTLGFALSAGDRGEEQRIKVGHASMFRPTDVKARMALDANWQALGEAFAALAKRKVSQAEAEKFLLGVLYPKESGAVHDLPTKTTNRLAQVYDYYQSAPGQTLPSAEGTAWGLLNAITYYVDHRIQSRTQSTRLDRAWFGSGLTIKQRAMTAAMALVS